MENVPHWLAGLIVPIVLVVIAFTFNDDVDRKATAMNARAHFQVAQQ